MARFDVYKFSSSSVSLVLDVQADLLYDLNTRVVVPLLPETKARKEKLPRLKPVIEIAGKDYVLMSTDIGTVRTADLGECVENVEPERDKIVGAIDFLLQGF